MLYFIKSIDDPYTKFIHDDPVRPHIPIVDRIGSNKEIFVAIQNQKPSAITCVSFTKTVPVTESTLFDNYSLPEIAVFYTIWSYTSGAGRSLIFDAVNYIKHNNKSINRFVTLSPKTEMAYRFHTRNGAFVLRENLETINYEYPI